MVDIVSKRYTCFIISLVLLVISVWMFFWLSLNYWIDITWGTQTEYSYDWQLDLEIVKPEIAKIAAELNNSTPIINTTSVYKITWENKFVIETGFDRWFDEVTLEEYKTLFREQSTAYLQESDSSVSFSKYVNIGASFGDYIKDTAKITLIIAVIWITLYVAYAFSQSVGWISSFSFAVVTIITLFHDIVIATWLYILTSAFFPEFKIDTFFVTALLTILWYSINDTIVVFDRIRWNLKQYGWKKKSLEEIITLSIWETISRSIYTSATLLFVLVAILLFGPDSISGFTLVMIFWTIVGTYSSIFIASPLMYEINKNKKLTVYKKKVTAEEDLIVV